MPRENLTDRRLKSLKSAPAGTDRYEVSDAIVPGLRVRVNEAGKKTFVLLARFPVSTTGARKSRADGKINPTRRTIGVYIDKSVSGEARPKEGEEPQIGSLEDARKKAREWLQLLDAGVDPQIRIAENKAKERVRQENSFEAVFDDYVAKALYQKDGKTPKLKNATDMEKGLRLEFVDDKIVNRKKRPGLARRPISGVTKADITRVILDKVDEGYDARALQLFAWVRGFFNWAIDRGTYDIEVSPCDRLKPKSLIGTRNSRDRVLTDEEIRALWIATEAIGYPLGPLYRILLLTGLRRGEAACGKRDELVMKEELWTIPADRMKGKIIHQLPLSGTVVEILQSLPIQNAGTFLFSTTAGEKAVNSWTKAKDALDKEMLVVLKRFAQERGEDPEKVTLKPFVLHDLRRTARTRMAKLGVQEHVAEAVIAHKKQGVNAVYNQWDYFDEKRDALNRWAAAVRDLIEPPPENVVSLTSRTASPAK
ncbi:site-specific integrase [Pararhizobium polonicum]|nr:site-specific integrase [Pararhizobium polonicum]